MQYLKDTSGYYAAYCAVISIIVVYFTFIYADRQEIYTIQGVTYAATDVL